MAKQQKSVEVNEDERRFLSDSEFSTTLDEYVRAGYQALLIPTAEESRIENELQQLARNLSTDDAPIGYVGWDCAEGFSGPAKARNQIKFMNPLEALQAIVDDSANACFSGDAFFHFKDLTDFQGDPTVRRMIRSLCENNRLVYNRWRRTLIITSPSDKLHDHLKSCISVVDFKLPGEEMLRRVLDTVRQSIGRNGHSDRAACSDELADDIVAALRGLTSIEAENTLARCLVRHKRFIPEILETIRDEKAQIIKKSEILTYIPETRQASRSEIGGFGRLLAYVDRRRLAYSKSARAINLDYPKGIVLIGVPGTGKSYVAMAIGRLLGLPAYILDISSVFGSLVGESESRMRNAMRQVEAQQGCVLVIDEIDKAMGGAADAQHDSGVTRRVFGQLLSWLANKQDNTFVIVTLNRTRGIPSEFFRAGRFDTVFYTDLPNEYEREQILRIHLRKRGVDPDTLDMGPEEWQSLVQTTQNFVGSELEELVREARYTAFEARQSGTPTFDELILAKRSIIPVATMDQADIDEIRQFCRDRFQPVSEPLSTSARTGSFNRAISLS